ncbi:Ubiquitin fusion degradation protein 1 like protein [Habropoda laboriosa]|uniref:Ubiquitin fusion degradation protein 1 homolog n=1 Tax=Habropoda laboriosa TaxID=597456 RepID=A0A0L7QPI0_9HYME|nr:PREDICTED: ubiquitin fusion degradation protein 1 homolog [Habropoda laboriosa]KOC60542.1 Ubiquitin fusion degradation protein 1 like protein [Habropoda laboriosa]
MFPERLFNNQYKCFSVSMLPGTYRRDVERGGKIIMPPSALEHLTRLNIRFPMLFRLTNEKTNRVTHCGVLEFVADEGKVYLPCWMMYNLLSQEGELITIESANLPVATFSRFQPQSEDFLDITNPKAVLENGLRHFACLTTGDIIAIKYNGRVYEMCVLETQPGPAVAIIECDMNVEFAPPLDYIEEETTKDDNVVDPVDLMPAPSGFVPFKGQGNRLNGKNRRDFATLEITASKPIYIRGIPDYDYKLGTLTFLRIAKPANNKEVKDQDEFKAFTGEGFSLREPKVIE